MSRSAENERNVQARSAQSTAVSLGYHPLLRVRDLYCPMLVTITVGNQPKQEFQVPEALICGQSKYFDKAFSSGHFKEGEDKDISLPDAACSEFEVFVGWLYTQRVCWGGQGVKLWDRDDVKSLTAPAEHGSGGGDDWIAREESIMKQLLGGDAKAAAEAASRETQVTAEQARPSPLDHQEGDASSDTSSQASDNETDSDNAVTWAWEPLIDLFLFADKYDTRRFRNAVIEVIQIKALQHKPKTYLLPSPDDVSLAFNNLPATSTLYRFLLDLVTWLLDVETEEHFASLPPAALAALWFKGKQLLAWKACRKCPERRNKEYCESSACAACARRRKGVKCHAPHAVLESDRPPYERDMCVYHEHETEEEKALCKKRWELIRVERGIR